MAIFETLPRLPRRVRFTVAILSVLALTMPTAGCNYIVLLGYLIGGPPSIEPDFDRTTKKSMTDKDVTVAVVCYAPPNLKWDFDAIDDQLAKYVSFRLNQHRIQVVNPDQIRGWLDENPDWDKPEEIGQAFGVSYVVYLDLQHYSLYEPDSANLYRGRAEGTINVYEMAEHGEGDKIYFKEFNSEYPLFAPRSTSEVTYTSFKREYLSRLSEVIGRHFYEYYNGDDIPDAT